MNKRQKQILYKNIGILFALTVVCAILSRCGFLAGGETLEEYAQKNTASSDTENSKTVAEGISEDDTMSKKNVITGIDTETGVTPAKNNPAEPEGEPAMNDRVTYQNGFYYESLSDDIKKRITGISYPADDSNAQIHYDDLCYVSVLYYNFNDHEKNGQLICNKAIAQDLVEIFYELYRNNYQIEKIRLIDEYQADDSLSMMDNNTSCFNYRPKPSGSLSNHAYGLAIDINPFFNPYVTYGKDGSIHVSPEGSEYYADREKQFAYKIDKNDLAYQLFTEHGFTWGGNWNSCKDYQHFEKAID